MDAYQKGNFKLYKGFDGKYSIKIDDESFRKDIEFSEVVREFEDVYWDNFISDYLRDVIGLNDWDIGKLRAKFVNMVSDEKGYKGFIGKERVFILTGYVSHSDIYKIESLWIDGKFINSKGVNGIIREIEGYIGRSVNNG